MNMKKIMSIMLALVLVLSMVPTAFAADSDKPHDPPITQVWLQKTYNAEKGHAFAFQFSATQDTETEGYITDSVRCTINDVSFTAEETGTTKHRSELTFGTFPKVGTYRYVVKETGVKDGWTDTPHEKLIMSEAEYEVLVYVDLNNAGNPVIADIVVNKLIKDESGNVTKEKVDAPDADDNGFNFENTYVYEAGYDPDDPDGPDYNEKGSLDVSKTVTKNGEALVDGASEAGKEFTFKATFAFPAGTDEKTLGGIKANGSLITLDTNKSYTFTLTHGDDMKLTGLPVGTKVTVIETGTLNYTAKASIVMNGEGASDENGTKGADLTVSDKKLGAETNTIDVTNDHEYIPPMGVLLNVLPYVLMLAIAGGMMTLFVAMKRKKAQYEEF